LAQRYQQLVKEHTNSTETLAAGLRALPSMSKTSFASTQAAWRFYQNEKMTLKKLSEPLLEAAHKGVSSHCTRYALCIHDWSRLNYRKHTRKEDRYQITHKTDVGYDLQSSLLISGDSGKPIAPVAQRLVTADISYATYQTEENPVINSHLDEVTDSIKWIEAQCFEKPLVHIIDREADSIGHIRQWEEAKIQWLTRSRISSRIDYNGKSMRCEDIAGALDFTRVRKVNYKGRQCWQWVAESPVCITRRAKPSQKKEKKPSKSGAPVNARLVVSRILSDSGEILANWLLITNVKDVEAQEIALWYYWRWQIESWFKLLKRAGHDLESWQQESGKAIAKRLLVASMACVVVWEIASSKEETAEAFRDFLIKLSGRQMKHKVHYTTPALLAGLWVFISMLEVFQTYSTEQLEQMKKMAEYFFS